MSSLTEQITASITLYESNGTAVYLGRNGEVWDLGPVTPDMGGKFTEDAQAWDAGDWEPSESNGQNPTTTEGLTAVATWDPAAGLTLLVDSGALGGAARSYLAV